MRFPELSIASTLTVALEYPATNIQFAGADAAVAVIVPEGAVATPGVPVELVVVGLTPLAGGEIGGELLGGGEELIGGETGRLPGEVEPVEVEPVEVEPGEVEVEPVEVEPGEVVFVAGVAGEVLEAVLAAEVELGLPEDPLQPSAAAIRPTTESATRRLSISSLQAGTPWRELSRAKIWPTEGTAIPSISPLGENEIRL